MMDHIDFELCLDVDQHEATPNQLDDVNITINPDQNHFDGPLTFRPRRTRTFSEIEDESIEPLGNDSNKRPKVLEQGDCAHPICLQEQTCSDGGEDMSDTRLRMAMDPFFPQYQNEVQNTTNALHAITTAECPGSFGVTRTVDIISGPDTTLIDLNNRRASLSSVPPSYLADGNITSFSSTETSSSNPFAIYEDPDGMDIDSSHIEVSQSAWPSSYNSWADDDKENLDHEEEADNESDNVGNVTYTRNPPHTGGAIHIPALHGPFPFPSSSSTMNPDRSIHSQDHGLDNIHDYSHPTQANPFENYRDQLFRRPWEAPGAVQGSAHSQTLSPPSPPHNTHLSDFDADDEADQDIILANSRHSSSMGAHELDQEETEMGDIYTRPLVPTFADGTEMPFYTYHPLREIPSMSASTPESLPRAPPRRGRRIRAFGFPL